MLITDFDTGHEFKNKNLLITALTHSSYANENKEYKGQYNERLEFLGDSVLSIIVSEYLYNNYKYAEGVLSKIRAALVCEQSLYKYSKKLNVGEYMFLGKGEENNDGRTRVSILADAFEAILGAIYLDGGMEEARRFAMPFVLDNIENAIEGKMFKDYKTQLQEIIQKNPGEILSYEIIDESGPQHNKRFEIAVKLNSNVLGKGTGKTKKDAEQMAAKQAMELMGE